MLSSNFMLCVLGIREWSQAAKVIVFKGSKPLASEIWSMFTTVASPVRQV